MVARDDLVRRHGSLDTLRRGCAFLEERAGEAWLSTLWDPDAAVDVRSRVLSNWLRELDSLLHNLIDEVTRDVGERADPERRSATTRWRLLPFSEAGDGADRKRLLGLYRSERTFWHYDGHVQRPDHPAVSWMTAGWPSPETVTLRRFPLGSRLEFSGDDLVDTCRFYERLGRLLARHRWRRSTPSLRAGPAAISAAGMRPSLATIPETPSDSRLNAQVGSANGAPV